MRAARKKIFKIDLDSVRQTYKRIRNSKKPQADYTVMLGALECIKGSERHIEQDGIRTNKKCLTTGCKYYYNICEFYLRAHAIPFKVRR